MSEMKLLFDHGTSVDEVPDTVGQKLILAVGDTREWQRVRDGIPRQGQIAFADFSDLTMELFSELHPRVVVSPLLTRTFDCIDLALWLASVRFRGEYRAVSIGLPSPEIVVREITSLCPELDFKVVELGKKTSPDPTE